MLWAALLPESLPPDEPRRTEALTGIATWCLQFTPRVSLVEVQSAQPAVVMELEASLRLFGGKRKLVERVKAECGDVGVGVRQLSWAATSMAAVALARSGSSNGFAKPLEKLLDDLPLDCLPAVAAHGATLTRLGCQTLGQVRALPRGGLSSRFDAALLASLDTAYGFRPEAHEWVELSESFHARMELMWRVELAPAMLYGARRLLMQMCGWLAARHSGVNGFTLRWRHDTLMRGKTVGDGGELTVRTAESMRDIEHLTRLLAENLAKVQLEAPAAELELEAVDVRPLEEKSLALIPDANQSGESLALALERIAARLGPESVMHPVLDEDHRIEWMCHWQPEPQKGKPRPVEHSPAAQHALLIPQPTFLLPEPLRLAMRGHRPFYQGGLQLLVGPHRVEGGWWDRPAPAAAPAPAPTPGPTPGSAHAAGAPGDAAAAGEARPQPAVAVDLEAEAEAEGRNVTRDYWLALSEHAGLLCIFQTRLASEDGAAWFLQGTYA